MHACGIPAREITPISYDDFGQFAVHFFAGCLFAIVIAGIAFHDFADYTYAGRSSGFHAGYTANAKEITNWRSRVGRSNDFKNGENPSFPVFTVYSSCFWV